MITYGYMKKVLEDSGHTVDMPVTGRVWVDGVDVTRYAEHIIEHDGYLNDKYLILDIEQAIDES